MLLNVFTCLFWFISVASNMQLCSRYGLHTPQTSTRAYVNTRTYARSTDKCIIIVIITSKTNKNIKILQPWTHLNMVFRIEIVQPYTVQPFIMFLSFKNALNYIYLYLYDIPHSFVLANNIRWSNIRLYLYWHALSSHLTVQVKGSTMDNPYVLYPHWNRGQVLVPIYDALGAVAGW